MAGVRRYPTAVATVVVILSLCVLLLAQKDAEWPYSVSGRDIDETFAARILAMDEETLSFARLAETHAEHSELRRVAKEMIRTIEGDGARMGLLKALAPRPGPPARSRDERESLIAAPSFDKAFIELMVARYEQTVELCRTAARSARTADVRMLASDLLASRARDLVILRILYDDWYGA